MEKLKKNYKKIISIICLIFIITGLIIYITAELMAGIPDDPKENDDISINCEIPAKESNIYMKNKLVSEVNYNYEIEIEIENVGEKDIHNITIIIIVPDSLKIHMENAEPSDLQKDGNELTLERSLLEEGCSETITFDVEIKESIPYAQSETLEIEVDYLKGSKSYDFECSQDFEIVPPPSWIIYFTIILGFLLLIVIILISKKSGLLEKFTTLDLINISILSALGVIVFKWIWQVFNDFLGIFGGLLLTIPTATLMIVAIVLVKKPGTATLFFLNWEFINFIIWGSSINIWLGWYLLEGVAVDLCIVIFKNYGENWWSAAIYGLVRGFIAYYLNYYWFAPAIWKIYYAPWYAWLQILMGCIGSVIGGINGYKLGKKLRESIIIS